MMISTRGRYALRVLVDLAEHSGGLVPMKDVAARQGISKKYMEQIMALLVRDGYVEGVHGKGGGYRLSRPPEQCSRATKEHLSLRCERPKGARFVQQVSAEDVLPPYKEFDGIQSAVRRPDHAVEGGRFPYW